METISGHFASLRSAVLLRDEWRLPRSHNPSAHHGLCSLLHHTKSRVKYWYRFFFENSFETTTTLTFLSSVDRQSHQSNHLYSLWISSAEVWSEDNTYPQLPSLSPCLDWSCIIRTIHKYLVSIHFKVDISLF